MTDCPIHILFADAISAAGSDCATANETLLAGKQPFATPEHFLAHQIPHGLCKELQPQPGESRAVKLAQMIMRRLPQLPTDTGIYLATTVGAIDCLEQAGKEQAPDCIDILQKEVARQFPAQAITIIAAACASGQIAIATAMRALRQQRHQQTLVIGLDIISEFVTSGFVSLGAVSRSLTRPYDLDRDGLLLGEGAGALLLSRSPSCDALGSLLAAGESCDAAHITAPDLDGTHLRDLISTTLRRGKRQPQDIGGILGHGTGTLYNDQSELAALKQVFDKLPAPPPLVSIKGGTGHTLAASGVLQIVYGLTFLRQGQMPPQAGLRTPAPGAQAFVSTAPRPITSPCLLSLNIGFGGLNSVLLLEGQS